MRKFIVILCIVFPFSQSFSGVGATTYNFLKIGVGARPTSLGSAFTAVANGVTTIYWNPAGCINSIYPEVSVNYNHYIVGIKKGYVAYVAPMSERTSVGIGLNYITIGDMVETNLAGDSLGTFGSSGIEAAVSCARVIKAKVDYVKVESKMIETYEPILVVGGSIKGIYNSIYDYNSHAIALDLGVLYRPKIENLKVGFCIQNLGVQTKPFDEEKEDLPLNFKLGGAYSLMGEKLITSLDLSQCIDYRLVVCFGVEWLPLNLLSLRFGYNSTGTDYKSGSGRDVLGGLSFGFGLRWEEITFDYGLIPMVELGFSNRISLSYKF